MQYSGTFRIEKVFSVAERAHFSPHHATIVRMMKLNRYFISKFFGSTATFWVIFTPVTSY